MNIFETIDRYKIEEKEDWHKWRKQMPFIQFPSDWEIQIIPPFAGAMVRFCVRKKGKQTTISIYMDSLDRLGFMNSPYWEVYPIDSDCMRFKINDTKAMLKAIEKELFRSK